MAIKPIPDGYTTVTPWLISRDTARLIAYLTEEVRPRTWNGA
jgi:PhnB protein